MTFSVKVGDIDTSLIGTGGRILSIKPNQREGFTTPTRPFSKPEFIAKSYLAFRGTLDGHLGAVQIDIRGNERYNAFLQNNGAVRTIRRRMIKFSDLTCCFENFLVLDVPPESPEHQRILKLYIENQLRIQTLNYISMPPINTINMDALEKMIVDWQNNADNYGKGVVPQLSMNEDLKNFQAKLNLLCELAESDVINIINLRYANPENYPQQYVSLWEKRETNVLFNCYNVPRKGKPVSTTLMESPILELQRYGIDTISPKTSTPSPRYIAFLQHQESPQRINELIYEWVYHPAGLVFPSDIWQNLAMHSIECNCKVCKKKSQQEIIDTYCYDDRGDIDRSSMDYVSKLHDGISSELEYSKIKRYIQSNEMSAYTSEIEQYRRKYFTVP
jgi:hypothetical protein